MSTLGLSHDSTASPLNVKRFAEIYSGPLTAPAAEPADAPNNAAGGAYVSNVKALRCARGALMALGLEAAAAAVALCVYGILQL